MLLAGTADGVWRGEGEGARRDLAGHHVVDLARGPEGWFALVDGDSIWREDGGAGAWEPYADLPGPAAVCLVALAEGTLLAGTREAHVVRIAGGGAVERVASFDGAPGRDTWYTPWGGPPDSRSLAAAPGPDGPLYVNVHVGGIVRSDDGGGSWVPTIDVHADVHQVLAPRPDDRVLAATARGLATSPDRGRTWSFHTGGLHAAYSRAVARAGDWVVLSASTGPRTQEAAVYRRPLDAADGVAFERCVDGLPEWFAGNIDTGSLAADGTSVALATGEGTVYLSEDAGATWSEVVSGLGRVSRLAFSR